MRLIRKISTADAARFELAEDSFVHLDDEAPLSDAPMLVSCERFERDREALLARKQPVGIRVAGNCEVEKLEPQLSHLALVAIEFPKFTDGRGYSLARRLRDQLGYQGHIRAYGNVLRDQLGYMDRVGFDEFELDPNKDPKDALDAFAELTVKYQAAADERLPLWKRTTRRWPAGERNPDARNEA